MRFILICLLGLSLVPSALAQPATFVQGVVVDEATGAPLPGASVSLHSAAAGTSRSEVTDVEGRFRFEDVSPGAYRLRVTFVGYAPHEEVVSVAAGESLELRLALAQEVQYGEEVVLTATRAREQLTPVPFSNVRREELEEMPEMKDLPVLLSTLPSTTYHSENGNGIGYSTLRMRGFDQRRIAVSINGIPQNDPEDFNVYWINFFDVQGTIRDVQVQRGAGAAVYGPEAIAGAINIETQPHPAEPTVRLEVGAGSFGTRRYTVEAGTGALGKYRAFGRYSRLLSDGYREWSWTEFHRFFGGVSRTGRRSTVTLQAAGGPQYDGLAFSGIARADNADDERRRANFSGFTRDVERFHQPRIELLHDWAPGPGVALRQALFYTKGEGYFDFGGTFRSADYLRLPQGWRGLQGINRQLPLFLTAPDASVLFRAYLDQWQAGWIPRATFRHGGGETTVGAEARLHRSQRWGRIQEAGAHPDSLAIPAELVGSGADVRAYQFHGEKVIGSVFASHLARPAEWVAVQGDLQLTHRRYRHYEEQFFGNRFSVPYLFLNPRLGITLNPNKPVSGYASVALVNREPRLKSLYDGEEAGAGFVPQFEQSAGGGYDFSDPLVRPERLLDGEVGFSLLRSIRTDAARERYVGVKANAFWMEFWDEIVPSGGLDQFGVPRSRNAEKTRHVGVEVEAELPISQVLGEPAGFALDLRGNATLSRNRYVRFTEYVASPAGSQPLRRDGNRIPGFPDRIANLALIARRGESLTLRADLAYAGRQYIDNSGARGAGGAYDPALTVEPYALVNASLRYDVRAWSWARGLSLSLDVNNVFDRKVLTYGNVGPAGAQFFPAATRHMFVGLAYGI